MNSKAIVPILIIFSSILLFFSCNKETDPCALTSDEAIKEVKQIEKLLNENSPYMNINNTRVKTSLDSFVEELRSNDKISKNEFSLKLKDVFAELGDRHFTMEYMGVCNQENRYYLPFSLAPWKDSIAIALVKKPKITFSFYLDNYPFLTRINNQKINEFIDHNDPGNKYAPNFSRLSLGVEKLNEIYKIKKGLHVGEQMKFTFVSRDFKSDTTLTLSLGEVKNKWREIGSYLFFDKDNDKIKQLLFREYENQIAYIKVPEMHSYSENRDYFQWLKEKMDTVKTTNALVIDLRNNPGGNRDLIDFFSNYLIAPNTCEVANLARYKGEISDGTKESLNTRGLHPYSYFEDKESKLAIDKLMKDFHPSIGIDEKLYSEYYYMIIKSKDDVDSYYYNKPVYILTNEMTFSAASVFASSFKGVKNIKIAGISTDGSSGMSKAYELKNSEIQLSMSHMLSYQKDGELFDGTGTSPDIEIHRSINHVLGQEDYQLNTLLEIINKNYSIEDLHEKE
jgi:hypothetical protein